MTGDPLKELKELRVPFADEQIGKLPKVTCGDCSAKDRNCTKHQKRTCRKCNAYLSTQHMHIDFVGHAHVTERLLDVDPLWHWEPMALTNSGLPALDDLGGLWIKLHVAGMTRIGYGHASGKRGGDAVKEVIGDAIRNAAMRFGVALDLWKKESSEPGDAGSSGPARQDRAPQTPEDRATELRKQIAAIGRARGLKVEQIAADFVEWSRGTEITSASVAVLAEYKDHLETGSQ